MIKNTVYRLILNFFNLVIPIITGMYVARIFSLEAYGAFNTANADLAIFLIFGSFGIYNYGIREVGRVQDDPERRKSVATSLFVVGLVSNFLVIFAFIFYIFFFVSQEYMLIYYLLILQLVANMINVEWINEGTENFKFITYKTVVIRSIYVLCLFLFVKDSNDVWMYTLLLSLSALLNNVISFLKIKNNFSFKKKNIKFKKYLYPLLVMMLIVNINYLYTQLDKLLVSKVNGIVATSFFHIPHYIINTIFTLLASIIIVSIPRLSLYTEKNEKEKYLALIRQTNDLYFFIAVPVFIGIAALAQDIMIIYGGQDYAAAYLVLIVASIYKIIASFEYLMGQQIMYIQNEHNQLMRIYLIGGVVNVVINVIMIYSNVFDPITTTIATIVSEIIVIFVLKHYIREKLHINFQMMTKNRIVYFCTAFLFFPISYIVSLLTHSVMLHAAITVFACAILYIVVIFISKDNVLMNVISMTKKKLKRF